MEETREPDEFEIHARTWAAQHGIDRNVAALIRRFGLEPELADRVHEAAVEDADYRGMLDYLVDFIEAFDERLEEDPALGSAMRLACSADPHLREGFVRFFGGVYQAIANQAAIEEDDEEDE